MALSLKPTGKEDMIMFKSDSKSEEHELLTPSVISVIREIHKLQALLRLQHTKEKPSEKSEEHSLKRVKNAENEEFSSEDESLDNATLALPEELPLPPKFLQVGR